MHGWDHGDWMFGSGGWMIFGWLWMGLVWLIPILLLFALGKYLLGRPQPGQDRNSYKRTALDILDEVYARGEISREDYLQKREDLQKK